MEARLDYGRMLELKFDRIDSDAIIIGDHIVMNRSEERYLCALIKQFKGMHLRNVLEVGFGLGITADLIQEKISGVHRHDIIEIESTIYAMCEKYAAGKKTANALLGDYYQFQFSEQYDLLFSDPYDYSFLDKGVPNSRNEYGAGKAKEVLREGGIFCFPFFGDAEMPEIEKFRLVYNGLYQGPPITLWDGSTTDRAQIGYYLG